MFKRIGQLLENFKKDRTAGQTAEGEALRQADLSEKMMLSLGIAMKLKMRVYIRIDVGNQSHALSVQGSDDTTLQYLYDLANQSWYSSVRAAGEARMADKRKGDDWQPDGRYVKERSKIGL